MLEKLNKNGEGLNAIIDNLQAGIIIIEEETKKILDLNATARDIIGLPEEEIKDRICHNFLCPAEKGNCPVDLKKKIDNSERVLITANGKSIPIIKTVTPVILDEKRCYLESFIDLSPLRVVEKEHSLLATAIEHAGESIVITDNKGNIHYVNPAFEYITGYKKEEVLGKNPRVLKSGKHKEEFYKKLWKTILGGNIWRGHFINKKKDGNFYEEEATISPVKDKSGKITGYVAVKRDVTEQMKQEEYLRQTQKLQAIVTLAKGIAHNFNNILVGIMGYLQIIICKVPDGSEIHTDLEVIQKACKRAMNIVKQFMCFSRKSVTCKEPVPIGYLTKDVLQFIKDLLPDTIELKENIKELDGMVFADRAQVQDLMINMCNNAVYAMKEKGGILEINLTDIYIDNQSPYSEFIPGHYMRLTVRDTGTGMDKTVRERIFEPFFTTKKDGEGSGMGLAIVHGIVKGHNGEILVESEKGKGSSFHIFLPICKNQEEKQQIR